MHSTILCACVHVMHEVKAAPVEPLIRFLVCRKGIFNLFLLHHDFDENRMFLLLIVFISCAVIPSRVNSGFKDVIFVVGTVLHWKRVKTMHHNYNPYSPPSCCLIFPQLLFNPSVVIYGKFGVSIFGVAYRAENCQFFVNHRIVLRTVLKWSQAMV